MSEKKVIQFDSTLLQAGNTNVAEAVETDDDLYFNETYVVIGARLSGNMIHATYDLTVIGDVEADTIEINGELTVNGNIKADKEKSTEKIDGAIAMIMALDRALRNKDTTSVYNDRGILIL